MALTATSLITFYNSASSTTAVTVSHTPTANRLVLALVLNVRLAGSVPTPTVAGNGLTWVQVNTRQFFGDDVRVTLFRAMGGSPSAGATTATFSTACTDRGVMICEIAGINTGGSNGADAVRQSAVNSGTTGTGLSATLAAFGHANNGVYGGWVAGLDSYTLSAEGGYSEIHELSGIMASFLAGNDTSPTATQSTSDGWGAIAIEIVAATVATPSRLALLGVG